MITIAIVNPTAVENPYTTPSRMLYPFVTQFSDTRILRFTVIDENAKEAKAIANELADVTAERVAYVMSSDKPKIVEEAVVPKKPSSPNTMKNTIFGALMFSFVAAAIIVIKYLVNDTVQNEEDIKKYLGLHMLAAIPTEKRK